MRSSGASTKWPSTREFRIVILLLKLKHPQMIAHAPPQKRETHQTNIGERNGTKSNTQQLESHPHGRHGQESLGMQHAPSHLHTHHSSPFCPSTASTVLALGSPKQPASWSLVARRVDGLVEETDWSTEDLCGQSEWSGRNKD